MKMIEWNLERLNFECALSDSYSREMRKDEEGDFVYEDENVQHAWMGWMMCRRNIKKRLGYDGGM